LKRHYIVIAGSIGVGKTTTTQALATALPNCTPLFEFRDQFLARFYEDPTRYAFLNQLAYSLQYLEQAAEIAMLSSNIVQDRSIYDTHQVFSEWRKETGLITEEEFELLARAFRTADRLSRPTLVVLLEAPVQVAMERIVERKIATELGLTSEFLSFLSSRYAAWFDSLEIAPKVRISTGDQSVDQVVAKILESVIKS
jgi:deoxyadenosine/deoxycytidine kinase